MYIQKNRKIKCSNCGAVDNYETVTVNNFGGSTSSFIRCLNCKHDNQKKPRTLFQQMNEPKQAFNDFKIENENTF